MLQTAAGNLGLENKKVGMLGFVASEIMFFTGLLGAYTVLRHTAKNWPAVSGLLDFRLGVLNTGLLFLSSLVFIFSLKQIRQEKTGFVKAGWPVVLVLGVLFLGVQFLEYRELWTVKNIHLSSSLFGACFYVLTALHGLHLLAGIVCLVWFWAASKPAGTFEALGLYWHFVDAVWMVLFVTFYIIG